VIQNFPEDQRNALLIQYAGSDDTFQQQLNALLKSFILKDPNPLLKFSAELEFENQKSKKSLLEFVRRVILSDNKTNERRGISSPYPILK
jgi:hypothetical protein